MLATLVKSPKTQAEWDIWSWAHRDQHQIVRAAIKAKYGIDLVEYQLYPIPQDALTQFLDYNQQSHDDINSVLGTQGTNLEQSDFTNPAQFEAWNYLHLREHEEWSFALGVS